MNINVIFIKILRHIYFSKNSTKGKVSWNSELNVSEFQETVKLNQFQLNFSQHARSKKYSNMCPFINIEFYVTT